MTGKSVSTKQLLGTVVAVQANFYRVQMDEEEGVSTSASLSDQSGVKLAWCLTLNLDSVPH